MGLEALKIVTFLDGPPNKIFVSVSWFDICVQSLLSKALFCDATWGNEMQKGQQCLFAKLAISLHTLLFNVNCEVAHAFNRRLIKTVECLFSAQWNSCKKDNFLQDKSTHRGLRSCAFSTDVTISLCSIIFIYIKLYLQNPDVTLVFSMLFQPRWMCAKLSILSAIFSCSPNTYSKSDSPCCI